MSWFSRCSWCGGPFNGGNCRRCTNVSFGDEFVCNSDPISNDETPDFSYPPSQPQTSLFDQFHCFHCGDPLEDGVRCHQCTCKWCGYNLSEGFCLFCASRNENSSIDAPNPNFFNDPPNVFTHPPQPQSESYSFELCGNDSHYGYDCPPRFPLVYEQEPSYNQNFSDNYYPQNSPSFPQQYPHESFQCQPMNQNHFEHNSNYSGFDQPPQYSIDHQEDLNQQRISNVHVRWEASGLYRSITTSRNEYPRNRGSKQQYLDEMESICNQIQIKDYRNEKIDIRYRRECEIMIDKLTGKFNGMSIEINKKKELRQLEQAANLSTYTTEPSRSFDSFYKDDDYEESIIPLNDIISQIPLSIAITPVLPTMEPEVSLSMGDEHLSTILEKESDEFIKSSVEDLVPIPSESEDTFESDSDCDLPSCDNFSSIDIPRGNSMTFSNPLFDSNDDFTSSDDESLSDEDVPEDNVKIYSNPLFEFDDEYISRDVNPLFDEVLEDIESEDSYVSKLDEPVLLVTPLSKLNEDECFDPGGDFVLEEIDACLTSDSIPPEINDDDFDPEGDILLLENLLNDDPLSPLPPKEFNFEELKVIKSDVSTDIEDDYHDSEGDIIYLESLLIKDTIPNLPPEVFLDRDPRSLEDEPDKDDLKNIVKVFNPGIHEKFFSPTYVKLPFEDHHYLSLTYVIRIFLPYFTYPVDSSLPFSSGSEDIIFDPGISASSLEPTVSHRSGTFMCFNVYLNILNGSPMEICSSTHFVPNIMMIWGESS
ncbi:hypothetical protein Tco_0128595 [Tanacetum coccineum]